MNHTSLRKNFDTVVNSVKEMKTDSFLTAAFYKHLKKENRQRDNKIWKIENYLSPGHESFLNPLNPVFLHEIYALSALRYVKFILVRDGAFGVIDFFNRFPTPADTETILILNETFAPFAPEAWQSNLLFCRMHVTATQKSNESLYLFGVCSANLEDKGRCKQVTDIINENKYKRVFAYLPSREDIYGPSVKDGEQPYQILGELYRNTKAEINLVGARDIADMKVPGNFLNLDEDNMLLFDNYLMHCLLSSGHTPVAMEKRDVSSDEHYVQLSEQHGMVLSTDASFASSDFTREMHEMKRLLKSDGDALLKSDFAFYLIDIIKNKLPKQKWYYSN